MAAAFAWEGAFVSAVGGVGARGPAAPQARRPAVDFWSRRWPWWTPLRRFGILQGELTNRESKALKPRFTKSDFSKCFPSNDLFQTRTPPHGGG